MCMSSESHELKRLARQLKCWYSIGPVPDLSPDPIWHPLPLDGARHLPRSVSRLHGHPVRRRRIAFDRPLLDLREIFGVLPGNPQCYLINEFTCAEEGTLTLLYSAE